MVCFRVKSLEGWGSISIMVGKSDNSQAWLLELEGET